MLIVIQILFFKILKWWLKIDLIICKLQLCFLTQLQFTNKISPTASKTKIPEPNEGWEVLT